MTNGTQSKNTDPSKVAKAGDEPKRKRGRPPRPSQKPPKYFLHAKNLLNAKYARGKGKSKRENRLAHKKGKRRQQNKDLIFSYSTLKTYVRWVWNYYHWLEVQGIVPPTFQDSCNYVQQYLDWMSENQYSAYSIKLAGCAVLKLFTGQYLGDCSSPRRSREEVKRGRRHDLKYFIKMRETYPLLYLFGLATGLRKNKELSNVRGTDLVEKAGQFCIHTRGKNGLYRDAPIIGDAETVAKVVAMMKQAGEEKLFGEKGVFGALPVNYDQHVLRSIYAVRIYLAHERPIESLKKEEKYCCARDYAGVELDRAAMKAASEALGHHRIDVVAYSYLWPMITMDPEIQAYFGIRGKAAVTRKKKEN